VEYRDTGAAAAIAISDRLEPAGGPPTPTATSEPGPTATLEPVRTRTATQTPEASATPTTLERQWHCFLPMLERAAMGE